MYHRSAACGMLIRKIITTFCLNSQESSERKAFLRKVEQLMMKLLSHAPVDGAADQLGKRFIHDTLPPVFTEGLFNFQDCIVVEVWKK